jgi:exodeoxyribonuclease VII small subunit
VSQKPTPKPPAGGEEPVSFEDAMARLERIVADLEGGRYTLEESLQKFEEGIALGNHCRTMLERADLRVRTLVEAGDRLVVSEPKTVSDEDARDR